MFIIPLKRNGPGMIEVSFEILTTASSEDVPQVD